MAESRQEPPERVAFLYTQDLRDEGKIEIVDRRTISHCNTGRELHTAKTMLNNAKIAINVTDKSLF